MTKRLPWGRLISLGVLGASTAYIHFRGEKRYGLGKQLTDHSTFFAPYNSLIYMFSGVSTKPVLDVREFPELAPLQENWETIREEALRLWDAGYITVAANKNDLAFNTFFKNGWKRFYLKWYDNVLPSARELCPKTVALIETIPSVHAALFANLQPHSSLGEHRDPFGGSLRYHLGLKTPNSNECQIWIDGKPYSWRDGQVLMFDETYIHRAENKTDEDRIILFCDIERPITNPLVRKLNHFVATTLVKETAAQNLPTEKIGVVNRVSGTIQTTKEFFSKMKKLNRTAYYAVKYTINGLILGRIAWGIYRSIRPKSTGP
jgi:beta-hydroxylase